MRSSDDMRRTMLKALKGRVYGGRPTSRALQRLLAERANYKASIVEISKRGESDATWAIDEGLPYAEVKAIADGRKLPDVPSDVEDRKWYVAGYINHCKSVIAFLEARAE